LIKYRIKDQLGKEIIMILKSLRGRLFVLVVVLTGLPIAISGFITARTAVGAMVAEKQEKLFGVTRMLDQHLVGTYDDILVKYGVENANRTTKIAILDYDLRQFSDEVAEAYPGIGVGYYNRELDAIITYGPSSVYEDKVGMPIASDHQGRQVMATGIPRVQEGDLVRGQIMNAMFPLVRDGKVIGYVWANELTASIQDQIMEIARHIYWIMFGGLFVGIGAIIFVLHRLAADIDRVKQGLIKLRENLSYRIFPPSGEIGEIAMAINDMAQGLEAKQALEEQVQRADRLAIIGEMASGLAHEIRNPLMAIKGFAELQNEDITPVERQEYTDIILREADRMDHLIEQLLCFARPTTDLIAEVNINEVLKDTIVLAEIRTSGSGSEIEFEQHLEDSLPEVMANEEQLKQVFLNILINASQAMENHGIVKVFSAYITSADEVRVCISDTGPGIEPELVEKIFDPFFTTKEKGTGLGLSVANHLMTSWGGSIRVDSMPNQGSTFTLIFPVGKETVDVKISE
jgi:two-component system sensor histidine kinase HydH